MNHPRRRASAALLALSALTPPSLAQQWEPSFPPNPSHSGHNFLFGVAATGADDAWVVGYSNVADGSGYDQFTHASRWDGTSWHRTPTPSPGVDNWGTKAVLYAVEAISPDLVWAAGSKTIQHPVDGAIGQQLLVLRWTGEQWDEIEAPLTPAGGTGAWIRDIVAIDEDDVWFVGMYNNAGSGPSTGLALHWDGSGFTVHTTPNITINGERNLAVSVAADGDLWIAGMVGRGGWGQIPYVLRGDGESWEQIGDLPYPTYTGTQTIVAFADDDAWTSAGKTVNGQYLGVFWLHWDGSQWTEHPVPDPYHGAVLTAFGPDDIYSAGWSSLYHWDGSAWSLVDEFDGVDVPNFNQLCTAPDGSVFGAGNYFPGGSGDGSTLAARYTAPGTCPADFNDDNTVDTQDVLAFLNAWVERDQTADFNGDGTVNTADVLDFLNAWNTGC